MLIITLVIALILAWPTFGLSLIAWIIFSVISTKTADKSFASPDNRIAYLKRSYFSGESQSGFIGILAGNEKNTLNVLNNYEMKLLGNMVIRYIATHPIVFEEFEFIIARYQGLATFPSNPPHGSALAAITIEKQMNGAIGSALYLLAYRSIEALTVNNPSNVILRKLDKEEIESNRETVEMSMEQDREMGRSLF